MGLVSAVWLRERRVWPLVVVLAGVCGLGAASGEVLKMATPAVWLVALAAQRFGGARVLDSRAAQFLGAVSYPLYLLNVPVQRAAALVVAPLAGGIEWVFTLVWLPLALAGPVLAAWGVHVAVERPLMRGWRVRPRWIASLRSQ